MGNASVIQSVAGCSYQSSKKALSWAKILIVSKAKQIPVDSFCGNPFICYLVFICVKSNPNSTGGTLAPALKALKFTLIYQLLNRIKIKSAIIPRTHQ